MNKLAHFFIDDTIWLMRDLTRQRPASMFDNPFLHMLKTAHERYGIKTQLNLFYKTSACYGTDDFCLADMTDAYKAEWEKASDWLKLAFHAKEEFPSYPLLNVSYDEMYRLFRAVEGEVIRFAGKQSFTYGTCIHWLPVSKAGVQALYDCGVRLLACTAGEITDDSNLRYLPQDQAEQLQSGRVPESRVFCGGIRETGLDYALCSYNHLSTAARDAIHCTKETAADGEIGMQFKDVYHVTLNITPYEQIETEFAPWLANEYIGICDHEQYFHTDYFNYQPDYGQRIYKMGEILQNHGFTYVFLEDLIN